MPADVQRLQLLRRVWLFSSLDENELASIAAVARERTCQKGEILVRQGDSSGDLFSVVQGRLKVGSVAGEGAEVLLSVVGPGDVFGEIALLDEEPRSATVVAAEPCRLLVVPRAAFRPLLRELPTLALRLLQILARHVRRLSTRTEDAAALDVRARLAKTLLDLAERFGVEGPRGKVTITLRLSQQELGRMIGATREMVNRCLRGWTDRRILSYVRGMTIISSRARLRRIAGLSSGPRRG
jgi:CRP/FNR family cyclic AMP-dependent transcriptional regulator